MSTPGAVPPPGGDQALDPTVLDVLRGSALAPMLDTPVNDILHTMGLPGLPELPAFGQLPDMPPLPTIDLSMLMQPLTDLAAAFGTGQFAAAAPPSPGGVPEGDPAAAPGLLPGTDPTQMLSQVSSVMQTVMQVGSSALQAMMTLWQSAGATEAAEKAGQAQTDAARLEMQSIGEKQHLLKGATSVAIGATEMTAVISAFSAKLALAPAYAGTPPGQAYLVASAVEAAGAGMAVTAKTKAELLAESGAMAQTGEKVKITDAPTGVASGAQLDQLVQLVGMVTPLIGTASQAAQSLGQLASANTGLLAPESLGGASSVGEPGAAEAEKTGAPGALGGSGVGGVGGVGGGAAPLGAFPGTKAPTPGPLGAVGALGGASAGPPAAMSSAANTGQPNSASGTHGPGYMPMGGGAGMAGAGMARDGESTTDDSARGMVSAEHGDEVVGPIEGVAVPVVGAAETNPEPPPDKELTL